MENEWLTAAEAAKHLKIKSRTLLQWARENKVPAHKLSGIQRSIWRFRKQELDSVLRPSPATLTEVNQ